jgi:hypothetical protein
MHFELISALDFAELHVGDTLRTITKLQARTDLECLTLCQQEEECYATYFSEVRKECILGEDVTDLVDPASEESVATQTLSPYRGHLLDLDNTNTSP